MAARFLIYPELTSPMACVRASAFAEAAVAGRGGGINGLAVSDPKSTGALVTRCIRV